jgi:hypothetical protein
MSAAHRAYTENPGKYFHTSIKRILKVNIYKNYLDLALSFGELDTSSM